MVPYGALPSAGLNSLPAGIAWRAALGKAVVGMRSCRAGSDNRAAPPQVRERKWHVQPCCATSGEGLWQGLKWLAENVKPI